MTLGFFVSEPYWYCLGEICTADDTLFTVYMYLTRNEDRMWPISKPDGPSFGFDISKRVLIRTRGFKVFPVAIWKNHARDLGRVVDMTEGFRLWRVSIASKYLDIKYLPARNTTFLCQSKGHNVYLIIRHHNSGFLKQNWQFDKQLKIQLGMYVWCAINSILLLILWHYNLLCSFFDRVYSFKLIKWCKNNE